MKIELFAGFQSKKTGIHRALCKLYEDSPGKMVHKAVIFADSSLGLSKNPTKDACPRFKRMLCSKGSRNSYNGLIKGQ